MIRGMLFAVGIPLLAVALMGGIALMIVSYRNGRHCFTCQDTHFVEVLDMNNKVQVVQCPRCRKP